MAFVDELKVYIEAGSGGNGVVRWLHEKGREFMGPAGGNGGKEKQKIRITKSMKKRKTKPNKKTQKNKKAKI